MFTRGFSALWIILTFLQSCGPRLPEEVQLAYDALPEEIDFNIHVKPILADKCFACHGPDAGKRKAGLRLDQPESALDPLPENPEKVAIDPGHPGRSELFHRILSKDPEYLMPAPESHLSLSEHEKAVLIKWIQKGAEYKPHWAFVKPTIPPVPTVDDDQRIVNGIDNFVRHRLKSERLQPSPEAEKELLLRRLSLDLTGLPPTIAETEAFLNDNSPEAYEKQVDRLIASPHYGEKMAVDWLDLARFADSHGYSMDPLRDMSPYRDWVIKSLNENLSYDKFIQWQLAGDMIPNATKDMIVATAFNRNHQQNMEGGIVEEEFQTEYVVDRTNTFGEVFLGLSVGCARCHDHKFDPITQKNYYELFSFFNNVKEAGQISYDNAMPSPTLLLPTASQEKIIASLKAAVAAETEKIEDLKKIASVDFEAWIKTNQYKDPSRATMPDKGLVGRYGFDDGTLKNHVNPRQLGEMRQQSGPEKPSFENAGAGKVLVLNGDVWLDLKEVGIFRKSEPFTIGIWVNIPATLKEGVLFHKSLAERLYNFRGYHLYLKENTLEVSMAHAAPSNAITKISRDAVPRDKWIHLALRYDGSSRADGLNLFLDGGAMPMETLTDQLSKDILFHPEHGYYGSKNQPGLQVGAWDRGFGFTDGKVDDIAVYNRDLTSFEIKILAGKASWSDKFSSKTGESLLQPTVSDLKEYYLSAIHPVLQNHKNKLKTLRTTLADSTEYVDEIMVMQEMPRRKKTFILERGNYNTPGEEVFPNTPESILPFPKNLPRDRYGLARWLTDPDNPLTARVAVNRFWQNFFGIGLVRTAEDFGNQGELPSHPQLLDWLATSFRESGWDMKALNKLIVMSATYRQDSRATPALLEKDPENRLLARGPSFRMSAEMIRDNALMASGLLNKKIGGTSVKPYQPEGLWQINNTNYKQDTGSAVYRRSLYVLTKRAVPNPTLATFDASDRSHCVARRQKTNTPLQALITLNDPTFIETARAIGAEMAKTTDSRKAIEDAFEKLTGRMPSKKEVNLLQELQLIQLQNFRQHPTKVKGWLHTGQYLVKNNKDSLLIAANAVVASTIMNSDATLMRR